MSDSSSIKEQGVGMFSAMAFWVMDEDVRGKVLYHAATWYRWALVECIQDWPMPSPFEEAQTPPGPKCILLYGDAEVKLMASAKDVFAGWQQYHADKLAREIGPSFKSIGRN